MILALRTDKPEAELYLFDDQQLKEKLVWEAHRALSGTILQKIEELISACSINLQDLTGIVFYEGPGSFTGLRIGSSVTNALASSLSIPIVATREDKWLEDGIEQLVSKVNKFPIEPYYGADAHITAPKK